MDDCIIPLQSHRVHYTSKTCFRNSLPAVTLYLGQFVAVCFGVARLGKCKNVPGSNAGQDFRRAKPAKLKKCVAICVRCARTLLVVGSLFTCRVRVRITVTVRVTLMVRVRATIRLQWFI